MKSMTTADSGLIMRKLATLLMSGVSIVNALEIILKESKKQSVKDLLRFLRNDVASGEPFFFSLQKFPKYFNRFVINMVKCGEETATLDKIVASLAQYYEKIGIIKRSIFRITLYPLVIFIVCVLTLILLLVFIVPQFAQLYMTFDKDLPACTKTVLNCSNMVCDYGLLATSILFLTALVGIVIIKNSIRLQHILRSFLLKLPVLGELIHNIFLQKLTYILTTCLAAGLPLKESLASAIHMTNHSIYLDALHQVQLDISNGHTFYRALQNASVFPEIMLALVSTGEESARLPAMLNNIADIFEQHITDKIDTLSKLIEPVIMIVLGIIVGFFVLTMYLPIFQLGSI